MTDDLNARIERQEPRFGNRGICDASCISGDKRRPLTIVVREYTASGSDPQYGLDGCAEFPAFAAAFPASTGMFTFKRMH